MADTLFDVKMRQAIAKESEWEQSKRILLDGEFGVSRNDKTDNINIKIGDGEHEWNDLPSAISVKDASQVIYNNQTYKQGNTSNLQAQNLISTNVEGALNEIWGHVENIEQGNTNIQAYQVTFDPYSSGISADVNTVQKALEYFDNRLDNYKPSVSADSVSYDVKISGIPDINDTVQEAIDFLSNKVDDVYGQNLKASLTQFNDGYTKLSTQDKDVKTVQDAIEQVKILIDKNKDDISTNAQNISSNDTDISNINTEIEKIQSDITTVTETATSNKNIIDTFSAEALSKLELSENGNDLLFNGKTLGTVDFVFDGDAVNVKYDDISTQLNVSNVQDAIETITTIVNDAVDKVDELDEKVTNFEQTLDSAEQVKYDNPSHPEYSNVKEILDKLLYIEPKILTFDGDTSKSSTIYQYGYSEPEFKLQWTTNKDMKSIKLNNIDVTGKTESDSSYKINSTTSYKLEIEDFEGGTASKTITFAFEPMVYCGSAPYITNIQLNTDFVKSLSGFLRPSKQFSQKVTCSKSEYIYVALPDTAPYAYGTPNHIGVDGFTGYEFIRIGSVKLFGLTYNVFRLPNGNLGEVVVSVD